MYGLFSLCSDFGFGRHLGGFLLPRLKLLQFCSPLRYDPIYPASLIRVPSFWLFPLHCSRYWEVLDIFCFLYSSFLWDYTALHIFFYLELFRVFLFLSVARWNRGYVHFWVGGWPTSSGSDSLSKIFLLSFAFSALFVVSLTFGDLVLFILFSLLWLFICLVYSRTCSYVLFGVDCFLLAFGSTVIVLLDCLTICPFTFLNALSNFDLRTLSLRRIVETASSLKSSGSISIAESFSEIHFSIKRGFGVFSFLPICFSKAYFRPSLFPILVQVVFLAILLSL